MAPNPSSPKGRGTWIYVGTISIAVFLCCAGITTLVILWGGAQFIQTNITTLTRPSQTNIPAIQASGTPVPAFTPSPLDTPGSTGLTVPSTSASKIILWTTTLSDTLIYQIDTFQQRQPNVTISITAVTQDDFVKLAKGDTGGRLAPDLILADNSDLWRLVKGQAVQPLQDIPQANLAGYTQAALNGMTMNGKLYGIPVRFDLAGFFYNTSMVDNPPKTTSELSLLYRTTTKFGLVKSPYFMMGWFIGFGGAIADKNGRCISTPAGFEDAINLMRQVRKYGSYLVDDPSIIREKFKAEQLGMIIDTSYELPVYARALGDHLASLPIPAATYPASPIVQELGFYLNPKSQNIKLATELALELSNQAAQTAYMADYWVPTRSDVQVKDPALKGFVDGAKNGYPIPQAAWYNNWEGPFQEMINQVLTDQFEIPDAIRLACRKMDTLNNK